MNKFNMQNSPMNAQLGVNAMSTMNGQMNSLNNNLNPLNLMNAMKNMNQMNMSQMSMSNMGAAMSNMGTMSNRSNMRNLNPNLNPNLAMFNTQNLMNQQNEQQAAKVLLQHGMNSPPQGPQKAETVKSEPDAAPEFPRDLEKLAEYAGHSKESGGAAALINTIVREHRGFRLWYRWQKMLRN